MKVGKKIVNDFKQEIRTETEAYSKAKGLANAELEVYMDAIYLGYLDACRTFKSQKKLGSRDKNIEKLAKQLQKFIDTNTTFEHEKYCSALTNGYGMSWGQAQKIVNMAFKYLYCLTNENDKLRDKFDKCHMPLDGVMLEWIYREIEAEGKKLLRGKIGAWSAIEAGNAEEEIKNGKYTYAFYQKILNGYCETNKTTQLQLDFENWKEMSITIATETFLKNFKNDKEAAIEWISKVAP